jgi:PhnB protein
MARKIKKTKKTKIERRVKAIPSGYRTVTPYLVIRGAASAIEFYKNAFGAKEIRRSPGPGGLLMHVEIKINDSIIMFCDEYPQMQRWVSPESLKGTTFALHIYVQDADATFKQAIAAGAAVSMPMMDAFWGDRYGRVTDPFGHEWSIATHQHDYSPAEMRKKAEEFFAKMPTKLAAEQAAATAD